MMVHINLWGVLVAGISSMVIGTIYYADYAFGKEWKKLTKIDDKKFKTDFPKIMPFFFLAALITAYVVAYVMYLYHSFFQNSWVSAGLETSLILWLGLSLTTLYVHSTMDQKPNQLTILSAGNRLLSILAMGLIVGWLHP